MNEYERERMRCHQCGNVVTMMWGHTCNKCRKQNEQSQELIEAIKENSSKKYSASEVKEMLEKIESAINNVHQTNIAYLGIGYKVSKIIPDIFSIFTKAKASL